MPTIGKVRRHVGVAGQVAYSMEVTYPGEAPTRIEFIGNVDGGPVVMVTPSNLGGTFVRDPGRFGDFGPSWVRKFVEGA